MVVWGSGTTESEQTPPLAPTQVQVTARIAAGNGSVTTALLVALGPRLVTTMV